MLRLEQLKAKIEKLGHRAIEKEQQRARETAQALKWLDDAPDSHQIRAWVDEEGEAEVQYALPVGDEPLDKRIHEDTSPPRGTTVIGVDGSQIMPDRHAPVLYYLLQQGGLIFRYDGEAPTPCGEASLHYNDEELYDAEGQIITRQVGIRRTVAEISYLAILVEEAQAEGASAPILAFTDGPLLWPYSGRSPEEEVALPSYLAAFTRLQEHGGMPIGFVERPGGQPLTNLLRLIGSHLTENAETSKVSNHLLLTDQELMEHFLAPGERTVWLKRPTSMNQRHGRMGHTIWFCYVNVGAVGDPVIARIECPIWAVHRERWAKIMHAVLFHQSRILGGHPYVLARAHELAIVTNQDKAILEGILRRRLLEAGIVTRSSVKARQKSYLGRR
ncbi:MAG: DNA double-strand break repair nuclease NurA [Anaerolineae bacterium]